MRTRDFNMLKNKFLEDVAGYCLSYKKYCSVGILDDKMAYALKKGGIMDIRALLGHLAIKEIAKMDVRNTFGTFIQAKIIELCKESVYSDSTCAVDDNKIPLILQLTKISNNSYYYAKGRISDESITFLAHIKAWGE